ncbi:hypothetical protein GA0070617_0995 [Micromonospora yangpuensis]|uniref:Uncharacterized protein n=1 Tax=Micromonospora yangpuensis TaxID=683228 RepID=A0A1C6U4K4_9ACTN|nr:hypothetical protein GA0070617_0995 [Micromonospora yangpuensis]
MAGILTERRENMALVLDHNWLLLTRPDGILR